MKTLVVLAEGVADRPQEELGGRTPLESARTPSLDRIALEGRLGRLAPAPEGLRPEEGAFALSMFGVDPREHPDVARRPQMLLVMAGSPPSISAITNRTVGVNTNTGAIPFTVGDNLTPATSLVVGGNSSDTSLVPNANIVFGGSGLNRTVTVTPAAGQSRVTVITVTVTDGDGLSASAAFTLTVGSHAPGVFIWNGPGAGNGCEKWRISSSQAV